MQISYTATSVLLSDKRRFPNFLRTIPSDNASISMIGAVLREYQWRQMAIITQRNGNFPNVCMYVCMYVCVESLAVSGLHSETVSLSLTSDIWCLSILLFTNINLL